MTTKHSADELADWVEMAYFGFSKSYQITEFLRTIPKMEDEIEALKEIVQSYERHIKSNELIDLRKASE